MEFITFQTGTSFHCYVTKDIKAWKLHESWHKAWSSIHECAMQLLWSSPVKHYECVNQVMSANAVPNFCFLDTSSEKSCCTNWGKIAFAENFNIDYGQSIHFSIHFITCQQYILYSISNTLLCNRLVRREQKVVQKTNHVLWQCTYSFPIDLQEISCSFDDHVLFLPEIREMSKNT